MTLVLSCLCYKKPQEFRESVLKTATMAKVSVYLFCSATLSPIKDIYTM